MSQVAFLSKIHKNSTIHHLVVRPINIAERLPWDTLMARYHYLGFKSQVGKSIRYVAEIQGQWVALRGWSAAALKCKQIPISSGLDRMATGYSMATFASHRQ